MIYIKNNNQIVAEIDDERMVKWIERERNPYFGISLDDFLKDRVFGENRRDIHTLLARLGILGYDMFEIAKRTRAFVLTDKFWLSYSEAEDYETTFKAVFQELYGNKLNQKGDSISSPSGNNEKSYIFNSDGSFGIAKKRLHPYSDDAKNEVVVYRIAKKIGVKAVEAKMLDSETVFSKYEFDINKQYLVHGRYITKGQVIDCDTYESLINGILKSYADDINRMILLDFLTLQDDRHLSNWAISFNGEPAMYPLYDNGRSLFYEANEEMLKTALNNKRANATSCGNVGTYYDLIQTVKESADIAELIELNPNFGDIFDGLEYSETKKQAVLEWLLWGLEELKK